ncbi:hypothetical protein M427DRAFT_452156 [Gonapodya prolifera JEL478]|uniref:Uncharacterized protein n=1 Tax=Gonapodya prolifera (strain JEL478) TaxID=1344416 RepID=A0A139AS80_GONPJ|nr:hypothetical protein M427DRAFT_452156 [Gonapodya prolifera JEL478]|eukprot:KXS19514.1 hypothetical protein M427DRAFT_452156 [Gonapodya prolifera JEL478]
MNASEDALGIFTACLGGLHDPIESPDLLNQLQNLRNYAIGSNEEARTALWRRLGPLAGIGTISRIATDPAVYGAFSAASTSWKFGLGESHLTNALEVGDFPARLRDGWKGMLSTTTGMPPSQWIRLFLHSCLAELHPPSSTAPSLSAPQILQHVVILLGCAMNLCDARSRPVYPSVETLAYIRDVGSVVGSLREVMGNDRVAVRCAEAIVHAVKSPATAQGGAVPHSALKQTSVARQNAWLDSIRQADGEGVSTLVSRLTSIWEHIMPCEPVKYGYGLGVTFRDLSPYRYRCITALLDDIPRLSFPTDIETKAAEEIVLGVGYLTSTHSTAPDAASWLRVSCSEDTLARMTPLRSYLANPPKIKIPPANVAQYIKRRCLRRFYAGVITPGVVEFMEETVSLTLDAHGRISGSASPPDTSLLQAVLALNPPRLRALLTLRRLLHFAHAALLTHEPDASIGEIVKVSGLLECAADKMAQAYGDGVPGSGAGARAHGAEWAVRGAAQGAEEWCARFTWLMGEALEPFVKKGGV